MMEYRLDTLEIAQFLVEVDVCGVTYYAKSATEFTSNESEAFKGFSRVEANQVAYVLNSDGPIVAKVIITPAY